MTPPKGVRVHAVCPDCGTVIDTTAPKGRVTWRGKCPGESCNRRIVAHRVRPGNEPAKPPKTDDDKPPARRRARRGTYDDGTSSVERPARRRPPARRDGDPAGQPAGGDPAAELEPASDPDAGEKPPAKPRAERAERPEPDRDRLVSALDIF